MSSCRLPDTQPVASDGDSDGQARLSIVSGPPLAEQPGLGVLTVSGWFETVCRTYAGREAIAFPAADGAVLRWTYAELFDQAAQVARALIASGHGKGEFVAVLATNRPEWLSSVFGILIAGCVAVPLSTFSTAEEMAVLLGKSQASTLIFESRVLRSDFGQMITDLVPTAATEELASLRFPFLRGLIAIGDDESHGAIQSWDDFLATGRHIDKELVVARLSTISPSDPAMIYFSSGSTGRPKGILNSNRGVAVQLWRWPVQLGLPRDGSVRGWGANGFFWSGAFAQAVGAVFSCGGTLILQPTFDARAAIELIQQERINYLTCWPHQYARMTEAPNYAAADLGSLRYITRGTAFEEHPTIQTDWTEPLASYGSTETFTFNTGFANDVSPEEFRGSHGRPFPGTVVKIVEPFSGETQPRGQSGEIAVKGATLMIGYVGVHPNETFDDQGFFHTGDGGHFDADGRLYFEGRLGDIIKSGGANVSPLEIDAVLVEIEGVKVCQTVGVPHDMLGEMIVSCVVPLAGRELNENKLRDQLKQRLASYKVPRRVLFVAEHELCLTGSAKVRTAALRELAAHKLQ